MQVKVNLIPNKFGFYGVSYFDENKKFHHFVVETLEDAYTFVAEESFGTAERIFKGVKFEVWVY